MDSDGPPVNQIRDGFGGYGDRAAAEVDRQRAVDDRRHDADLAVGEAVVEMVGGGDDAVADVEPVRRTRARVEP